VSLVKSLSFLPLDFPPVCYSIHFIIHISAKIASKKSQFLCIFQFAQRDRRFSIGLPKNESLEEKNFKMTLSQRRPLLSSHEKSSQSSTGCFLFFPWVFPHLRRKESPQLALFIWSRSLSLIMAMNSLLVGLPRVLWMV
jgi:hypothetical protein